MATGAPGLPGIPTMHSAPPGVRWDTAAGVGGGIRPQSRVDNREKKGGGGTGGVGIDLRSRKRLLSFFFF